jgi:hypothetical protein
MDQEVINNAVEILKQLQQRLEEKNLPLTREILDQEITLMEEEQKVRHAKEMEVEYKRRKRFDLIYSSLLVFVIIVLLIWSLYVTR